MNILEELTCGDGTIPSGPVSAWPQERHFALIRQNKPAADAVRHETRVKASIGTMAKGLISTAAQAVTHGKVSPEIREERYDTCKSCPFFVEESKRCSECGCFMEAKTWVGGDPNQLCPKQKWNR